MFLHIHISIFSQEVDDPLDQSGSNRIKAAFSLMGIEFQEDKGYNIFGHVDYKMKHIRYQNRHLKLHHKTANPAPKHIHFDDEGCIIDDTTMEVKSLIA